MNDFHIKQDEISYARSADISSVAVGELHHQLVGIFVNKIYESSAKSLRILEIGCGKGVLRKFLSGSYYGIDPIELPECAEFQFKCCIGQDTGFPDSFFDIVIIKDGINYYPDLNEILSEVARIVKPTGCVVLTEFVGKKYSLIRFVIKKFIKFKIGVMRNPWDDTYLGYFSHSNIIRCAGVYFNFADYKFKSSDERYFVTLSGPRKSNK